MTYNSLSDWSVDGTVSSTMQGTMIGSKQTMPVASSEYLGYVIKYTGPTNANYTKGKEYICVSTGASTYEWQDINGNVEIVNSWESPLSESKVPSEQLTKTALDQKMPLSGGTITGDMTVNGTSTLKGNITANGNISANSITVDNLTIDNNNISSSGPIGLSGSSVTAPTPSKTDDSSKVATTAFVKDVTEDYVQKQGDTMTGALVAPRLDIKNGDMRFIDNNANIKGSAVYSSSSLIINNQVGDLHLTSSIGNVYAQTPQDYSDDSQKVATTHWVNNADTLVHKAGTESIPGSKTFTATTTNVSGLTVTKDGPDTILSAVGDIKIGTEDIGSATHPVYIDNGVLTPTTQALNDSTITIQTSGGSTVGDFSLNQSSNETLTLPASAIQYADRSVTFVQQTGASIEFADYPYRGAFAVTGITADDYAEVTFSQAQVDSGYYAPFCRTDTGYVYLYANSNVGTVTIPTISVGNYESNPDHSDPAWDTKLGKINTAGLRAYTHNGADQGDLAIDDAPTTSSGNLVKSGGVQTALDAKAGLADNNTFSGANTFEKQITAPRASYPLFNGGGVDKAFLKVFTSSGAHRYLYCKVQSSTIGGVANVLVHIDGSNNVTYQTDVPLGAWGGSGLRFGLVQIGSDTYIFANNYVIISDVRIRNGGAYDYVPTYLSTPIDVSDSEQYPNKTLFTYTQPSANDNSTKVATTAWVNTADSVVHKTGNETIPGEKTFTGTIKAKRIESKQSLGTATVGGWRRMYYGTRGGASAWMKTVFLTITNKAYSPSAWGLIDFAVAGSGSYKFKCKPDFDVTARGYFCLVITVDGGFEIWAYTNSSNQIPIMTTLYTTTTDWLIADNTSAGITTFDPTDTSLYTTYAYLTPDQEGFIVPDTPPTAHDAVNKTYVDGLDAQNVKLSGDQTKSGRMEFTGLLTRTGANPEFHLKDTTLEKDTIPTSERKTTIFFDDKNGTQMGSVNIGENANVGDGYLLMRTYSYDKAYNNRLILRAKPDGTSYAELDNVRAYASGNTKDIVTQGALASNPELVHTTGNETVAGIKTFRAGGTTPISIIQHSGVNIDNPLSAQIQNINFVDFEDTNGNELCRFIIQRRQDESTAFYLQVKNADGTFKNILLGEGESTE